MWVIYNEATGYEIDRVESRTERDEIIRNLTESDVWGYTYSSRWEA